MQIAIHLDSANSATLQTQIFEQMVALIHGGQLKPGGVLPSSRELSRQLGVSRNTVSEAYDRLASEGFIHTAPARGTFVRSATPEDAMDAGVKAMIDRGAPSVATNLPLPYSARGLPGLYSPPDPEIRADFRFGRADAQSFPEKTWRRLLLECLGGAPERISQYNDPSGLPELRQLIAEFVGPARGIRTKADNILVVGGFQQGINLAAHLLVGVNTPILIEAPCYQGAVFLFESYGGKVSPADIDDNGIIVERLPPGPVKLIYVTPSHQFPTGVTMTLDRRLQLLEWAARVGAYILEVDYDSDFRYEGQILPSLQSLDRNGCVIYLNSFSRSLGPGLRLGYMILPDDLIRAASILKGLIDNGCPWLEQATLAQFMRNGSLKGQLKRVRQTYMRRRDAVIASLDEHFGEGRLTGREGGTHMLWRVPSSVCSATELARRARLVGVGLHPLQEGVIFHQNYAGSDQSILLGYTHLAEAQIADAMARVARAAHV
jgi:GntR family transcriptional regulator/MocR family aminotransferase